MRSEDELAAAFEESRAHLRGVAYRMLGSVAETDDAVQQAWLRASQADRRGVEHVTGWLTTITARVCLDMLRARRRRSEQQLPADDDRFARDPGVGAEPEHEVMLAESVGLALLVVLDRLSPAQRVAFVLHDLFAVAFDDIAPVLDRSTVATKKLASRARRQVRGATTLDATRSIEHRAVVDAFLAAARGGDLDALVELLAPGVVRRADRFALPRGAAAEVRGAQVVAEAARVAAGARRAEVALVDGEPGIVVAPLGRLLIVLRFSIDGGRITEIDAIADPARLAKITLAVPSAGN